MKTYTVIVKVELEGEFQVQAFDADDAMVLGGAKASNAEIGDFDVRTLEIMDVIEQKASP